MTPTDPPERLTGSLTHDEAGWSGTLHWGADDRWAGSLYLSYRHERPTRGPERATVIDATGDAGGELAVAERPSTAPLPSPDLWRCAAMLDAAIRRRDAEEGGAS